MKYRLEPLNEGQSMNCVVPCNSNRRVAISKAFNIACALQQYLTGATITCRVSREKCQTLVVDHLGGVIDEATGQEVVV